MADRQHCPYCDHYACPGVTPSPASHEQVEALRKAASQASFCLRELLPNDEDAKMTIRMLEAALHHQPSAQMQGESE